MAVKEFYENVHGDYQGALNLMISDAFVARMLGKFAGTIALMIYYNLTRIRILKVSLKPLIP